MPKRNLIWMALVILIAMLFWNIPLMIAGQDSFYRNFGPLLEVHALIRKHYVTDVDNRQLLEGAVRGMMKELDTFSGYISQAEFPMFEERTHGKFAGIGIEMDQVDGMLRVISPIEGTPAFKAGIRAGDVILAVDGKSLEGLSLIESGTLIKGPPGSEVTLRVQHANSDEPTDITIIRDVITIYSVKGVHRKPDGGWNFMLDEDDRIGYVRVSSFNENTVEHLDKALAELRSQNAAGIILDLRYNSGGLLDQAVAMADRFMDGGTVVSTVTRRKVKMNYTAGQEHTFPMVPMAVIINSGSASASEIVAGALQDHKRAVIVGERSYGKGSVQNVIPLEDEQGAIRLTTAHWQSPSSRCLHKTKENRDTDEWGVKPNPDCRVELTPEQVEEFINARNEADVIHVDDGEASASIHLDPQLRRALEVIRRELGGTAIAGIVKPAA